MKGYAKPNVVRPVAAASSASIRAALESRATNARADDVAKWLAGVDDTTFIDLVEREARGQLPPEVADIFGHPRVCDRWHQALKALQMRAAGRKGIANYLAALADRKARAVHAIREANEEMHRKRLTVGKTASPRHRAIDRLILAHPAEFEQYVHEEQAKDAAE